MSARTSILKLKKQSTVLQTTRTLPWLLSAVRQTFHYFSNTRIGQCVAVTGRNTSATLKLTTNLNWCRRTFTTGSVNPANGNPNTHFGQSLFARLAFSVALLATVNCLLGNSRSATGRITWFLRKAAASSLEHRLACGFVRSVFAFWFATPRTPPLWQRDFFLVN